MAQALESVVRGVIRFLIAPGGGAGGSGQLDFSLPENSHHIVTIGA